jgi:hypothetical protein
VLADYFLDTYASFYAMRCVSIPETLQGIRFGTPAPPPVMTPPSIGAPTMNVPVRPAANPLPNILFRLDPPASTQYTWTFQAAFYRFDGDTLCGQVDGTIIATHV